MPNPYVFTTRLALQGPVGADVAKIMGQLQSQIESKPININLVFNRAAIQNLQSLQDSIGALSSSISKIKVGAAGATTSLANISQATQPAAKGLQQTAAAQREFNNAQEQFGLLSAVALKRLAAFLSVSTVLYGTVRAFSSAISEAISFDRTLIRLGQVLEGNKAQVSGLREVVNSLSTAWGVSSKDLIQGAHTLVMAGFSYIEAKQTLQAVAKATLLPSFGEGDIQGLSSLIEGLIAIKQQFNIQAKDFEKTLSQINVVVAKYAVETQDVFEAVRRGGSAFAAAGGDLKDFLAMFSVVRGTTRESAETIASAMRMIFTRLQRGTTSNFFESLNIHLREFNKLTGQMEFVGPMEAMSRIAKGMEGVSPQSALYANVVEQIGGGRHLNKVIPLLQQQNQIMEARRLAMNANNDVDKQATQGAEALAVQFAKVGQEFKKLVRDFMDDKSIRGIIALVTEMTKGLIHAADVFRQLAPIIALFAGMKATQFLMNMGPVFTRALTSPTVGGKMTYGLMDRASGGFVPGTGNTDSQPALLTPGEYVFSKQAVSNLGLGRVEAIHKQAKGYAGGGLVGDSYKLGRRKLTKAQHTKIVDDIIANMQATGVASANQPLDPSDLKSIASDIQSAEEISAVMPNSPADLLHQAGLLPKRGTPTLQMSHTSQGLVDVTGTSDRVRQAIAKSQSVRSSQQLRIQVEEQRIADIQARNKQYNLDADTKQYIRENDRKVEIRARLRSKRGSLLQRQIDTGALSQGGRLTAYRKGAGLSSGEWDTRNLTSEPIGTGGTVNIDRTTDMRSHLARKIPFDRVSDYNRGRGAYIQEAERANAEVAQKTALSNRQARLKYGFVGPNKLGQQFVGGTMRDRFFGTLAGQTAQGTTGWESWMAQNNRGNWLGRNMPSVVKGWNWLNQPRGGGVTSPVNAVGEAVGATRIAEAAQSEKAIAAIAGRSRLAGLTRIGSAAALGAAFYAVGGGFGEGKSKEGKPSRAGMVAMSVGQEALGFGMAGMMTGNPYVAGGAAFVGAIVGVVKGLKEFDKALQEQKIGESLKQIERGFIDYQQTGKTSNLTKSYGMVGKILTDLDLEFKGKEQKIIDETMEARKFGLKGKGYFTVTQMEGNPLESPNNPAFNDFRTKQNILETEKIKRFTELKQKPEMIEAGRNAELQFKQWIDTNRIRSIGDLRKLKDEQGQNLGEQVYQNIRFNRSSAEQLGGPSGAEATVQSEQHMAAIINASIARKAVDSQLKFSTQQTQLLTNYLRDMADAMGAARENMVSFDNSLDNLTKTMGGEATYKVDNWTERALKNASINPAAASVALESMFPKRTVTTEQYKQFLSFDELNAELDKPKNQQRSLLGTFENPYTLETRRVVNTQSEGILGGIDKGLGIGTEAKTLDYFKQYAHLRSTLPNIVDVLGGRMREGGGLEGTQVHTNLQELIKGSLSQGGFSNLNQTLIDNVVKVLDDEIGSGATGEGGIQKFTKVDPTSLMEKFLKFGQSGFEAFSKIASEAGKIQQQFADIAKVGEGEKTKVIEFFTQRLRLGEEIAGGNQRRAYEQGLSGTAVLDPNMLRANLQAEMNKLTGSFTLFGTKQKVGGLTGESLTNPSAIEGHVLELTRMRDAATLVSNNNLGTTVGQNAAQDVSSFNAAIQRSTKALEELSGETSVYKALQEKLSEADRNRLGEFDRTIRRMGMGVGERLREDRERKAAIGILQSGRDLTTLGNYEGKQFAAAMQHSGDVRIQDETGQNVTLKQYAQRRFGFSQEQIDAQQELKNEQTTRIGAKTSQLNLQVGAANQFEAVAGQRQGALNTELQTTITRIVNELARIQAASQNQQNAAQAQLTQQQTTNAQSIQNSALSLNQFGNTMNTVADKLNQAKNISITGTHTVNVQIVGGPALQNTIQQIVEESINRRLPGNNAVSQDLPPDMRQNA